MMGERGGVTQQLQVKIGLLSALFILNYIADHHAYS